MTTDTPDAYQLTTVVTKPTQPKADIESVSVPLTFHQRIELYKWRREFDGCYDMFEDVRHKNLGGKQTLPTSPLRYDDFNQQPALRESTPRTLGSLLWKVITVPYDYYKWYKGIKTEQPVVSLDQAEKLGDSSNIRDINKIYRVAARESHPDKADDKSSDNFVKLQHCKNEVFEKGVPPVAPLLLESPWYLHAIAAMFAMRHAFMADFVYRGLFRNEKKAQEWLQWAYTSPKSQLSRLSFDLFFRYAIPLDLQLTHDMVESGQMHNMVAHSDHVRHQMMNHRPENYKKFSTSQSAWSFLKGAVKVGFHRLVTMSNQFSQTGILLLTSLLYSLPQGIKSYNRQHAVTKSRYQATKQFLSSFVTSLVPSLGYSLTMAYTGGSVALGLPVLILTSNIIGFFQQSAMKTMMKKEQALTSFNQSISVLDSIVKKAQANPTPDAIQNLLSSDETSRQLQQIVQAQRHLIRSVPEVQEMAMLFKLLKLLLTMKIPNLKAKDLNTFKTVLIEIAKDPKVAEHHPVIFNTFREIHPSFKLADLEKFAISDDKLNIIIAYDALLASGTDMNANTIQQFMAEHVLSSSSLTPIEQRYFEYSLSLDSFFCTIERLKDQPAQQEEEHKEAMLLRNPEPAFQALQDRHAANHETVNSNDEAVVHEDTGLGLGLEPRSQRMVKQKLVNPLI